MRKVDLTNGERHWILTRLERIQPEARTEQERRLHEKVSNGYTGTPLVANRRYAG